LQTDACIGLPDVFLVQHVTTKNAKNVHQPMVNKDTVMVFQPKSANFTHSAPNNIQYKRLSIQKSVFLHKNTIWDRCYDLKNIFGEKIGKNIGVFVFNYC
jgi:hypothetical protein